MVEDLRLPATRREKTGTAETRRLRRAGQVPMVVYGLGRESESVSADQDVIEKLVATRSSVVDLELNGDVSKAVVQALQWDVYSTHVQHIDLRVVDPDGRTTADVPIELRGEPSAIKEGAVLRQCLKTVRVSCPDYRVPKFLPVKVGALNVGESVKVSDLSVPETATVETNGDEIVAELHHPKKAAADSTEEESAES